MTLQGVQILGQTIVQTLQLQIVMLRLHLLLEHRMLGLTASLTTGT